MALSISVALGMYPLNAFSSSGPVKGSTVEQDLDREFPCVRTVVKVLTTLLLALVWPPKAYSTYDQLAWGPQMCFDPRFNDTDLSELVSFPYDTTSQDARSTGVEGNVEGNVGGSR